MPRVKLTEYEAKRLIIGDAYRGVSLRADAKTKIPAGKYVVKVDEGVKRRMKQGLVALNVAPADIGKTTAPWKKKGWTRFIAEPMVPHEEKDERYLSLERVREGLRMLYAREGGIEIETHPEKVERFSIANSADIARIAKTTGLPEPFLAHLVEIFDKDFFSFLEINPLIVNGERATPLDAAVLVDSAGAYFARGAWSEDDIVGGKAKHAAEERVAALQATTPASLKLSVVNPDGSLFFLLSGGGGSIVIADEAELAGVGSELGNYGEYSGGPTREETYLYAKEVLGLMLASKAKKKALVIAGGVANFTDIKSTFAGIIDALSEKADALRKANVKVFVRRGGPNEREGLAHMKEFLEREKLLGSIAGSEAVITEAVDEAIDFVKSAAV
ncbi:hypothetical protein KGQ55_03005 [Patescibacteria group bacterium]|nr:hypothetical protein [Patescibacteria group bacterium]